MQIIPKILVVAGSIRSSAYSARTADVAMKALALQGAEVTRISLADYPLPIIDEDALSEDGIPRPAMDLARQILAHDGVLIASPEYNASIPPLLKNAIDWVSRVRKDGSRAIHPFAGKAAGLCSSSESGHGGMRGLYHLRAVLMACGAEVVTAQCSVPHAKDAFDRDGNFRDDKLRREMDLVAQTLTERAAMLSARVDA